MTAPFGVELNTLLDKSLVIADLGNGKFQISPPSPHPSFSAFYAEESRTFGVVWLKGVSSQINNDAFGSATRAFCDKLTLQLEKRYGRAKRYDLLHAGSIWNEPRDWMASVHQNQRSYMSAWKASDAGLPDDLAVVTLLPTALNHDDALVGLEYLSSKHQEAEHEQDSDLSSLL